jgi:hypothetical protein
VKRRQELVARNALPPLRGSGSFFALVPWAYAHGYMLPSLRDSGNAQLQELHASDTSENEQYPRLRFGLVFRWINPPL